MNAVMSMNACKEMLGGNAEFTYLDAIPDVT